MIACFLAGKAKSLLSQKINEIVLVVIVHHHHLKFQFKSRRKRSLDFSLQAFNFFCVLFSELFLYLSKNRSFGTSKLIDAETDWKN